MDPCISFHYSSFHRYRVSPPHFCPVIERGGSIAVSIPDTDRKRRHSLRNESLSDRKCERRGGESGWGEVDVEEEEEEEEVFAYRISPINRDP